MELDFSASFGRLTGPQSIYVNCCLSEIQRSHLNTCPKSVKRNPAMCLSLCNQVGFPEGCAVFIEKLLEVMILCACVCVNV